MNKLSGNIKLNMFPNWSVWLDIDCNEVGGRFLIVNTNDVVIKLYASYIYTITS